MFGNLFKRYKLHMQSFPVQSCTTRHMETWDYQGEISIRKSQGDNKLDNFIFVQFSESGFNTFHYDFTSHICLTWIIYLIQINAFAETLLELQQGDERSSQDKASSGSSLTLQLDTDSQSSEFETFAITVFGGRDSGK